MGWVDAYTQGPFEFDVDAGAYIGAVVLYTIPICVLPLVLLARSFASVYVIPSGSMAPALAKNDVLLVEKAGGKTSDGVTGGSILDVEITAVDQRTALCIGSANEVDRFNEYLEWDDDGCNTSK